MNHFSVVLEPTFFSTFLLVKIESFEPAIDLVTIIYYGNCFDTVIINQAIKLIRIVTNTALQTFSHEPHSISRAANNWNTMVAADLLSPSEIRRLYAIIAPINPSDKKKMYNIISYRSWCAILQYALLLDIGSLVYEYVTSARENRFR